MQTEIAAFSSGVKALSMELTTYITECAGYVPVMNGYEP